MLNQLSKNSPWYYLHTVVTLLIIFCFFNFVPAVEPLTPLGIRVLGVFIAVLYGWVFCDVVWPSLMGLIMLGMSGYGGITKVFASSMGNSTVIMLILFCAVTAILSSAGIAEYISAKMVGLKIVRGRPYMLTFMLMLVMVAFNLLVSATAAIMMFYPLVKEVSKQFGFKAGDKWPIFVILSGSYIGCRAYQLLPFKSGPAVVYGSYTQFFGVNDINYAAHMACAFVILAASIGIVMLLCRFVFKPDVTPILHGSASLSGANVQLTGHQKYVLISFLVLLVLLLWPNVAPKGWGITKFLNAMTTNGILMAYIAIYVFIHFREGIGFKEILCKEMSWPALYVTMTSLTMAAAFQADTTGIMTWIKEIMEPFMAGKSALVFVAIITFLCMIVTNVANNLACLAMFSPLACTIGMSLGGDIQMPAILFSILMIGSLGIITPPASTLTAYLYGEKEWLPGNCVMTYGILYSLINWVVVMVLGYGLGSILF